MSKNQPEKKIIFKNGIIDLLKQGESLSRQNKYEEAIECFDNAIVFDNNCTEAYIKKGRTLYVNKKYKEAIECYDKALYIDHLNVKAICGKGFVLTKSINPMDSIDYFYRAISIDQNCSDAYIGLGIASASERNFDLERSIKYFDNAIMIRPTPNAYAEKAHCLRKKNKYEEAIKNYEEALKLNPNYYKAQNALEPTRFKLNSKPMVIDAKKSTIVNNYNYKVYDNNNQQKNKHSINQVDKQQKIKQDTLFKDNEYYNINKNQDNSNQFLNKKTQRPDQKIDVKPRETNEQKSSQKVIKKQIEKNKSKYDDEVYKKIHELGLKLKLKGMDNESKDCFDIISKLTERNNISSSHSKINPNSEVSRNNINEKLDNSNSRSNLYKSRLPELLNKYKQNTDKKSYNSNPNAYYYDNGFEEEYFLGTPNFNQETSGDDNYGHNSDFSFG